MKYLNKNIILPIIIAFTSLSGYAQDDELPCPTCTPVTDPLPIDSNLILLTLAGTLFGLYTINKHKTNKKRPV